MTGAEPARRAGPEVRPPLSLPFFEIGPKNILRRQELHELLAAAQLHSRRYRVSVIATLPVTEIEPAALLFPDLHLFAQHMDPDLPGKSVGRIIAEALADAGASGVMLNHADHLMPRDDVAAAVVTVIERDVQELDVPALSGKLATLAYISPRAFGALRPALQKLGARNKAILLERTARKHARGS